MQLLKYFSDFKSFAKTIFVSQTRSFFFFNFRIIFGTCHVVKQRSVPKSHICWISFNGSHNLP